MTKLPPTPPFSHRLIVGSVAVVTGIYAFWQVGKDYEFIKKEPRSPEEIEERRKQHLGLQIKHLETRTLEYTPEAKQRLRAMMEQKQKEELESANKD